MNEHDTLEKQPRVLIVDDEVVSRLYIEQALYEEGYEVISAENGAEAVELVKNMSPDLIVMDVMMPVLNGYDACRLLRKKEVGVRRPIMMLTGLEDAESVEKSFAAGATDFVTKPVNISIFKQRVRYGLATYSNDLAFYKQSQQLVQAQRVAKIGYWEWDLISNKMIWSDEVRGLLSLSEMEMEQISDNPFQWVHPEDRVIVKNTVMEALASGENYSIEHRVLRQDKKLQVVSQQAYFVRNESGNVEKVLGVVQESTEKYISQQEIRHLAYFDTLTDLPNTTYFKEQLSATLKNAVNSGTELALLTIDIDRFKNINNSLGHNVGDNYLKTIANELKSVTKNVGGLGKLNGVKFVLFVDEKFSWTSLSLLAKLLLRTIAKTYTVLGNELLCTASIGITTSVGKNNTVDNLILQADQALHDAREKDGNCYVFYNDGMKSKALLKLTIERELRNAIEDQKLSVYYQPKCCVQTGRIVGMEALLRWFHPQRGFISPEEFIPVAEESGLIIPLGEWVLAEATQQTSRWHQLGFSDLVISINVSVKQFHQAGFLDMVFHTINRSNLGCRFVDLEITESCTMNSIDKAITLLTRFRAAGISISMDDFGTGFSSMSFLQKLPLDKLKVDREFIKNIGPAGEDSGLARLIIAVAKELKLEVVAEGVESEEHLKFLQECQCDEYQGYYKSPAVSSEDFERLLLAEQGSRMSSYL